MLAADDLAGPADHADGWLVLVVVLLVAVVAWNGGLLWWGRPIRRSAPVVEPPVDVAAVRREHLHRLAVLEARVRSGDVDLRTAHLQLSALTRSFVHETTDIPARHLTLAELREHDLPAVAAAVAVMYPPEFGRDPQHDPARAVSEWERALTLAREAVHRS